MSQTQTAANSKRKLPPPRLNGGTPPKPAIAEAKKPEVVAAPVVATRKRGKNMAPTMRTAQQLVKVNKRIKVLSAAIDKMHASATWGVDIQMSIAKARDLLGTACEALVNVPAGLAKNPRTGGGRKALAPGAKMVLKVKFENVYAGRITPADVLTVTCCREGFVEVEHGGKLMFMPRSHLQLPTA